MTDKTITIPRRDFIWMLDELKDWYSDQAPYGCSGYDKMIPKLESYKENIDREETK